MSWLNALGSAAQGVTAGLQDLDRYEDRKYVRQQRERQAKRQEKDDAYDTGMAGLDPNAADFYEKARALAYQQGRYGEAANFQQAAQADQDRARRFAREDIADRQTKLQQGVQNAFMQYYGMKNPNAALQALQGAYDNYPDGHKLVINQDGTYGVAGPDAKWAVAPMQATPENVQRTLDFAMKFLHPNLWKVYQQDEREGKELGLKGRNLDITEKHYGDQAAYWQGSLANDRERNRILGIQADNAAGAGSKLFREDDGGAYAYDHKGNPQFSILPGGVKAPLGVNQTRWEQEQMRASRAGVKAVIGDGPDGKPMLAYQGRDGQFYGSLEAAAAAKAPGKR